MVSKASVSTSKTQRSIPPNRWKRLRAVSPVVARLSKVIGRPYACHGST